MTAMGHFQTLKIHHILAIERLLAGVMVLPRFNGQFVVVRGVPPA